MREKSLTGHAAEDSEAIAARRSFVAGPAARAGLRPEDVIVKLGGRQGRRGGRGGARLGRGGAGGWASPKARGAAPGPRWGRGPQTP